MAAKTRVFCLEESMWDNDLEDRESVLPALELMERLGAIKFIHRHVATREEFDTYIDFWRPIKQRWSLVYLAFHGTPGHLDVESTKNGDRLSLEDVGKQVGRCSNVVFHLGSCSTVAGMKGQAAATAFLEQTHAVALTGFTKDVEWLASAAFDLLLFDYLSYYASPRTAIRKLKKDHAGFCRRLGFRSFP